MASYSMWNAWGTLGAVLRKEGVAVLVNKCFGPRVNAGISVGGSLSAHCNMLAGNMFGAFAPAIHNAWGAGDFIRARKLAFQTCRIGTMLILIFALPLSLEVSEVLRIWLKTPPRYAAEFCLFVMAMTVIDKMAVGHMLCVNANGKVAKYQAFLGTSLVMTLPLAWLLLAMGGGVYSVGWTMVGTMTVCAVGRVLFARRLVGMSARYWVKHVFLPLVSLVLLAIAVGSMPRLFMGASFIRVCVTTAIVEAVLVPLSWFLVFDQSERVFLSSKFAAVFAAAKR